MCRICLIGETDDVRIAKRLSVHWWKVIVGLAQSLRLLASIPRNPSRVFVRNATDIPFDLKLVSVKFAGLGLALPTLSFGF